MGKVLLTILILSGCFNGFCQGGKLSEIITATAEELAAEESDPMAAETFAENLFELAEDPVSINSADENEISRLFFLSPFQVKVLADYVKTSGKIVSVFEIAQIPGFSREAAEMMIPFITLEYKLRQSSDSLRMHHTVLTNFIWKKSYEDKSYLGSPLKMLTKYRFTAGALSGGFTTEKDQGERFFSGHPGTPDFLSAHIGYNGTGFIKRIVIGDFSAHFGLGTNTNTGLGTGISLSSPGYIAGRNEISPYTSTDENNFFRGVAAVLSHKNTELSFFLSSNRIDATLNEPADSTGASIKNLFKTGYHNTESSIIKKDVALETGYGINLSFNFNNIRAGVTWSQTRYSLPIIPDNSNPADKYDFNGNKNSLYTIYYNSLLKRFIFFGELSYGGSDKYAFVQGISFRPVDRLNINALYRSYSPRFVSFRGRGPGISTSTCNEEGIYASFTFEAARFLFVSAGCDIRSFPWLRYRCSSPSNSQRSELRIRYLPSEKISLEGLYNIRNSQVDNSSDRGIPILTTIKTQSGRVRVKYSPDDNATFTFGADYKKTEPSGNKGISLLQDLNFKFRIIPVTLWMRYCIYNTGGFDSGIYSWENDLLYSFSIPVMYGSGTRGYIMVSWKPSNKIELRLKFGTTERKVSGAAVEDPEIKFQLKIYI